MAYNAQSPASMPTDTPHDDADAEDEDDDPSVFERIQDDPEICNNCFRRYQAVYEINGVWLHKHDAGPSRLRDSITDIVTDERIPGPDTHRVPNEPAAKGTRRVCTCGYPTGETNRPLSKPRFMHYGVALLTRVTETTTDTLATNVSPHYFYRELYTAKTDPARQFADDDLYADAVAMTVQDARTRANQRDTDADHTRS